MGKTKVIVVHRHEHSQGSTILAVCRANEAGHEIADAMIRAGPGNGLDEIEAEEMEITEFPQPSNLALDTLLALVEGEALDTDRIRALPKLIERGLVARDESPGDARFKITTIGRAALAAWKERPL